MIFVILRLNVSRLSVCSSCCLMWLCFSLLCRQCEDEEEGTARCERTPWPLAMHAHHTSAPASCEKGPAKPWLSCSLLKKKMFCASDWLSLRIRYFQTGFLSVLFRFLSLLFFFFFFVFLRSFVPVERLNLVAKKRRCRMARRCLGADKLVRFARLTLFVSLASFLCSAGDVKVRVDFFPHPFPFLLNSQICSTLLGLRGIDFWVAVSVKFE